MRAEGMGFEHEGCQGNCSFPVEEAHETEGFVGAG
jgi:hypothetical protein